MAISGNGMTKRGIRFVGSGVTIMTDETVVELPSTVISGIEVVTIPLADYAALLDCRRKLLETELSIEQFVTGRRSVVDRNPEVAVYLAQNFGLVSMKELLRECRRKFGGSRTPSQSAAYRYWATVRKKSSKKP